ncbi:hypothetical protein QBC35DRAFT_493226 [Podospora australis]|uniref:Phospholipid-transporting ATPase n=1 Tax=Podospora australis TaxID=1536484 RepID=A0AAN7AKJ3_9PEZI|nr:hypothetical protein QBC35DRAFT_493226 [Podospora australis]
MTDNTQIGVEGEQQARPAAASQLQTGGFKHKLLKLLGRAPLPPSTSGRQVPLLADPSGQTLIDPRNGRPYIPNTIRTSRYTIYNFLPKQLIFQFTRLANFYFLCVAIPQMIPGVSTTGTYTTIIPLMLFISFTISKEGYDDYKRYSLDKVENARSVLRLGGGSSSVRYSNSSAQNANPLKGRKRAGTAATDEVGVLDRVETGSENWRRVQWRDLQVGDIVHLKRDEDVPADIVLLHAESEGGLAYVETMALDGETNLKVKQVSAALKRYDTFEEIINSGAMFVVEDPNPDLYRFEGRVELAEETLPLTLNEIILRGCTIRNTAAVIGVVINTGEECKMRMNTNRNPQAKRPAVETTINKIVLTLVLYVLALVAGCAGGYVMFQRNTERTSFYIQDLAVPWAHQIFGNLVQFNNVIPLALYVSLEIIKIGQMYFLNSDIEMYDEKTDTPAKCNTTTILEDLGCIGYVFSDKTGTLTENVMKFRKVSIAGVAWMHEMDLEDSGKGKDKKPSTWASGALGPTSKDDFRDRSGAPGLMRQASRWRPSGRPDKAQPALTTGHMLEHIRQDPDSPFAQHATQYMLALSLCHTCLPEWDDGEVDFQAASPDELALVRAAQELGYLVVSRTTQTVTIRISPDPNNRDNYTEQTYQILDVIEFTSKRKRMSITLRCPDGRIWLLTKGADSAILPRLRLNELAKQKESEVRQSVEVENQQLRKLEYSEPRNSFGGRPSLNIRRSFVQAKRGSVYGRTSFEMDTLAALSQVNSRSVPQITIPEEPASRGVSPTPAVAADLVTSPGPYSAVDLTSPGPFSTERNSRFSYVQSPTHDGPAPTPKSSSSRLNNNGRDRFSFLQAPTDEEIFGRVFRHLDDFSSEGLRTLLFAHRYLSESEYDSWKKIYREAETSLVDRELRIEEASEHIEQSLDLLGASGIEDKLQEGVAETIDRLRRANIKIWMLTGDKRETAINIAHSARICKGGSNIYILDATKPESLHSQIQDVVDTIDAEEERGHNVVVIDGHTLTFLEAPSQEQTLFIELVMKKVDSVICCRASPAQKAFLVTAVRNYGPVSRNWFLRKQKPLTLAIGDGANDLSMLLAAHVGIGISGKEGLQAARVADYAIAQFRFLARLLLVHGRLNYARTARYVLATFWKESFFYLGTAYYQRLNGYTGTSLYESASLTVSTTMFTSLCVILPGIWEQELQAETLLAVPELYVFGQRGKGLNLKKFAQWMFGAALEGTMVWFLCWNLYGGEGPVKDGGLYALGTLVFSVNIVWINLKLSILDTNYKTSIILGAFGITFAGWWIWQVALAGLYQAGIFPYIVKTAFFTSFGNDAAWWVAFFAVQGCLAMLELIYRSVKRDLVVAGLWKVGRQWLALSTWKRAVGDRGRWEEGKEGKEGDGSFLEDWDVELWQVMERDPVVKEKLGEMSKLVPDQENHDDAHGYDDRRGGDGMGGGSGEFGRRQSEGVGKARADVQRDDGNWV